MGFNVRDYFGMKTTVRHVYGAYPLPDGLREGDEVTLVDFQTGYWHVERDGKRYRVAMAGVGNAGRLPFGPVIAGFPLNGSRPIPAGCGISLGASPGAERQLDLLSNQAT